MPRMNVEGAELHYEDLIPGARFVVLPHAGHSSSLEQPEAVTAALREFFRSA